MRRKGCPCHIQHAHDSLIFRASLAFDGVVPHSAIELFPDESIKMSVPAVLLAGAEREVACTAMEKACGITLRRDADVMSAKDTLRRVTRIASLLDRYVRSRQMPWQTYAVAYEL